MKTQITYRGRFAPSPTGKLHFGSLVTAVASYLQAKHQYGEWLLRIDDIDPAREEKGAATHILKTLEAFGFEWDGEVLYQSDNQQHYQDKINQLLKLELAYPCSCSRRSILKKTGQIKGQGEILYPGFCRDGPLLDTKESSDHSIRLRCNNRTIEFNDRIQGQQSVDLEKARGDFILQRRDKYFSYQLASGIDDAEQGITEVVRGTDLLECTPCQLHVQHVLQLNSPEYCHVPTAVNTAGQKLSKLTHAAAISPNNSADLLYRALKFLGQKPPIALMDATQDELWRWAISHWQLELISRKAQQIYHEKIK